MGAAARAAGWRKPARTVAAFDTLARDGAKTSKAMRPGEGDS